MSARPAKPARKDMAARRQARAGRKACRVNEYQSVFSTRQERKAERVRARREGKAKPQKTHEERVAAQAEIVPELTEMFGDITINMQRSLPASVGTKQEIGVPEILKVFSDEAKAKFFFKNKFVWFGPDDCFSLCAYTAAISEDKLEKMFFIMGALVGLYANAPDESLLKCQALFADMHKDVPKAFHQKFGERFVFDAELTDLLDDIVAI